MATPSDKLPLDSVKPGSSSTPVADAPKAANPGGVTIDQEVAMHAAHASSIKKLDADGDGVITTEELVMAAKRTSSMRKSIWWYREAIMITLVICVILFGIFLGIILLANRTQGKLKAGKSGLLRARSNNHVVRSGAAVFDVNVQKIGKFKPEDLEKITKVDFEYNSMARTIRIAGFEIDKSGSTLFSFTGHRLVIDRDSVATYSTNASAPAVGVKLTGALSSYPTGKY